jgi:hypothetical protein
MQLCCMTISLRFEGTCLQAQELMTMDTSRISIVECAVTILRGIVCSFAFLAMNLYQVFGYIDVL